MNVILWSVTGVVVALVTFGIVDWRTRSARGERTRRAHRDVVTVIAKLLAQGQARVDLPVIESVLKTKAREYDVNLSIADELPKIVEDTVARFTESEVITPKMRQSLLQKAFALQRLGESRRPTLKEAVADLEESSRLTASYSRRNTLLGATVSLLAAIVTLAIIAALTGANVIGLLPTYAGGTCAAIAAAVVFSLYQASRARKLKEARTLAEVQGTFEEMVLEVLGKTMPEAMVQRNVRIETGKYLVEVDFIINVNGITVPIKVKHGLVKPETIAVMAAVMKKLATERGMIITSMQGSDRTKKMAMSRNVTLLTGITSAEDLTRGLKDADIVGPEPRY
jgi:predicted RecB family endonuclease